MPAKLRPSRFDRRKDAGPAAFGDACAFASAGQELVEQERMLIITKLAFLTCALTRFAHKQI